MGIIYYQAELYEIFIREREAGGRGGDEDRRGRVGDGQRLVLVGFGGLQTSKRAYLLDVSGVREFVGEDV